jgi:hypothetical protein
MQDNALLFEKEEGPSVLASFLSYWAKQIVEKVNQE